MAADQYRHAEDEYFKLRGQFDTGRLTQEQFDEKLRELMIHDAQGRYWMLGADSGKWYYYDGAKWVQGEPYAGATPPPMAVPVETRPLSSPDTAPPLVPLTANPLVGSYAAAPSRGLPIVPIIIAIVLIALAIIGFLVFQNRDRIFVSQRPAQITPILPPTITRAPSPTAGVIVPTSAPATLAPVATAVPTDVPPTAAPTLVPPTVELATVAPAITIVVVTAEPTATIELPTLLPSATTPPTAVPTAVPTKIPATATNPPPTATSVPNCPSGVCVTKITYSPSAPKRNQDVTFTATFVNSTGGTQNYNFVILLYDPNKPGNNKGFGESQGLSISVPPGEKDFSVTYTPVKGPGGCINLYMRAGWKVSAFEKPIFPNTSGDPVQVSFDVCP